MIFVVRLYFASLSGVFLVIGLDAASEACYAVQRKLR